MKNEKEKSSHRELTDTELATVSGCRHSTIHPAKVTVPDLKLAISYS
jgi:hypothetical protein